MLHEEPGPTIIRPDFLQLDSRIYSIRQLSSLFQITSRAIRFYCDIGLLTPIANSPERFFDQRNVRRLALVKIGTELGFPLRDIGQMLRDSEEDRDQPYLEVPAEKIDREIDILHRRRALLAEQLRWLLACKKNREPSMTMQRISVA